MPWKCARGNEEEYAATRKSMMRHRNTLHYELRLEQRSVFATATNTVTATIAVGGGPLGGAVSPDGGTVYFANAGSNTVSVIAAVTNILPRAAR